MISLSLDPSSFLPESTCSMLIARGDFSFCLSQKLYRIRHHCCCSNICNLNGGNCKLSTVKFKAVMKGKIDVCRDNPTSSFIFLFSKENYLDRAYIMNEKKIICIVIANLQVQLKIPYQKETYQCCCHDIFFSLQVYTAPTNWHELVGVQIH